MKKALAIVTILLASLFLLCGCGKTTPPDDTTIIDGTPAYPATTPNPPICKVHQYEETILTMPGIKTEGMIKCTCKVCHSQYLRKIPPTNSIKILAIGNSFSSDAVEYLWDICDAADIEDVVIGNLYIGGCSLDAHWINMEEDNAAYQYYLNDYGTWKSSKRSIRYALESEDWDIITIQQVSQDSGRPETFRNLDNIIGYINEHKTNEYAKIYWHMTWAYQSGSSHSGFANYGRDQMLMYNAIVSATQNTVLKTEYITGIIPSGTAIQNLRTSAIGDTLTRDGYHMSYDLGRYTAALTWFKTLTGLDIESIDWMPKAYADIIRPNLDIVREAVDAAVEKPFEVTESSRKPEVTPPKELTDADKQILRDLGLNPEDYTALDWEPVLHTHWNSAGGSTRQTIAGNPNSKIMTYYNSSKLFSKSDLPNGTVIVVDDGYQYRPEGWITLSTKNTASSRPANVSTHAVTVNANWWGNFSYRAFNVSHIGADTDMTEEDSAHFHIYVPIKTPDVPTPPKMELVSGDQKKADFDALVSAGIVAAGSAEGYELLDWNPTVASYYNSATSSNLITRENSTATNLPYFTASSIFSRADLPEGTIIVVDDGYQYRPEGWTALSAKNTASSRPANVTTSVVIVDSAWWGSFNHRAFNLSHIGAKTNMTAGDSAHLRIYVPKA